MKTVPVSIIATVLNEAHTIEQLLNAIVKQTQLPAQLIIIDGGSSDDTISIIKRFQTQQSTFSPNHTNWLRSHLILKKITGSNRALARNAAISMANQKLIAITDAGCIPQPTWLEHLYQTYLHSKASIVGGYFYGLPKTAFEQAVVTYTLPMPDRVDALSFVPTTRSVLITKKIWQKLGRFDEKLKYNEDYPFFLKAKNQDVTVAFAKEALVGWMPRSNLLAFAKMIFRFAEGDVEAGIVRPKVQLLFGRYLLVSGAIGWLYLIRHSTIAQLIPTLTFWLSLYLIWSIWKNYKYTPDGWMWLPILQLTADSAVMTGSIAGLVSYYRSLSSLKTKN